MTKRFAAVFAAVLLVTLGGAAQNVKQATTSDPSAASKKLITISGLVGADGKTLVANYGKTIWTVTNSEALLDNVGERVSIRAQADAQTHELRVSAVRIDPTVGARLHDAAFRR